MKKTISHDWAEESMKAKARWFQSLSLEERMEIFCSFTDLILEVNPKAAEKKYVKPAKGSIRILTKEEN
jgi:hypothetical protein